MTSRRSFLGTVTGGVAATTALRGVAGPPARSRRSGCSCGACARSSSQGRAGHAEADQGLGHRRGGGRRLRPGPSRRVRGGAGERGPALPLDARRLGAAEGRTSPALLKDADALGATTARQPVPAARGPAGDARGDPARAAPPSRSGPKACRAAGKRFGYHIHGHEFGPAPEGTLFDVLAKEAGPDVGFEIDVFWVTMGGADPVALMDKYPGRFWYTHLKDMAKGVVPSEAAQHRDERTCCSAPARSTSRASSPRGRGPASRSTILEDESADPIGAHPEERGLLQDALEGARCREAALRGRPVCGPGRPVARVARPSARLSSFRSRRRRPRRSSDRTRRGSFPPTAAGTAGRRCSGRRRGPSRSRSRARHASGSSSRRSPR